MTLKRKEGKRKKFYFFIFMFSVLISILWGRDGGREAWGRYLLGLFFFLWWGGGGLFRKGKTKMDTVVKLNVLNSFG